MSCYYYECEFLNWNSDTRILIKTQRKLEELDALHILNKYYKTSMAVYEANNIPVPEIGDLNSITRVMQVDFEHSIIICDGDTAADYNIIISAPTNKHPGGLQLEIPANMPANCAVSLLTEIAEEWAYEHKLVRCTWATFLDAVTDEFLEQHGVKRNTDYLLPKCRPIYLEPRDHVLTQSVTVVTRDDNHELMAAYQVEMPNSILTEQDILNHFTKIAKTMAKKQGARFDKIKLNALLQTMAGDERAYENFNTKVRPVETEAVVTFNGNKLLTSD